jgi:CRP/FNR family cyclic AMP-dependent transcriptional regulator
MRKALFFLGILSDTDIDWIVRNGSKVRLTAGSTMIHQGKATDSLYFLLDGEFSVSTTKARDIAKLKAGEMVGEISFVDARPPTASVTALSDAQVGVISRSLLATRLKEDVGFASRFYRAVAMFLADRLRTTLGTFGTGALELDEEIEDVDEVAPHLLDNISLAGTRFSEMQRRTWGGR